MPHIFKKLALCPNKVLQAWLGLFKTGNPAYYGALIQASS